jgi:hypothetical protein
MVIHESLLVAVQLHPSGVVTLALSEPLPEPKDLFVGEIEEVHEVEMPSCVTVNVLPAMVIVPIRENSPALDETK